MPYLWRSTTSRADHERGISEGRQADQGGPEAPPVPRSAINLIISRPLSIDFDFLIVPVVSTVSRDQTRMYMLSFIPAMRFATTSLDTIDT